MLRTYIVTGAAGFIGSHLCASLLDRGERVVGIDNFDPFYDEAVKRANVALFDPVRFRLVEADIRDRRAIQETIEQAGPDVVFHIAALAGVRSSIADPARYTSVNVGGTASLLEAMRACDCRRLVFASSSSVYGNNEKIPFSESDPVVGQISPYAATKRAGELLCQAYCNGYGFSIGSLRFFTVYGPAQRPDLAIGKFMRLIAKHQPIPVFGDGATSRDYTNIEDILQGVLAASERVADAASGFFRIWNLGHSQTISLEQLIATIGRVVGKEPLLDHQPLQVGDVLRTCADLTRSREELGYQPTIDFEKGLARQWEWMKDRL